jgi:hypothetical protein
MNRAEFRELNNDEKLIIDCLLKVDFPGKEAIAEQIVNSLVTVIDENSSLRFNVKTNIKADVRQRVPIEAEYDDTDNVIVHLLLHVVDGTVKELEVYKDDASPIIRKPAAENLRALKLY